MDLCYNLPGPTSGNGNLSRDGCEKYEGLHIHFTYPIRLNQPVIQDAKGALVGVLSLAAQKYGPPEVGWDEQISAIAAPTVIVKTETTTQPQLAQD